MGVEGLEAHDPSELSSALQKAVKNQRQGLTSLIEVHMTAEPTAIFRADAMQVPHRFLAKYSHLNP